MHIRALAGAFGLLLALTACSAAPSSPTVVQPSPEATRAPWSTDLITASRQRKTAPEAVQKNTAKSCGDLIVEQGGKPPADALDCLNDALMSGTAAQLALARPTTEGDPIIYFFQVGPGIDGVRFYLDSTLDTFGSEDWTENSCPGLTTALDVCTVLLN